MERWFIMQIDKLITAIDKKNNPTVAGLDPKLDYLPDSLKKNVTTFEQAGEALFEFNKQIIDHLYDIVPAVKPQIAYYEMYGIPGLVAFKKTCEYAKKCGLVVVGDAKRNDIGSTAGAYSTAFLGETQLGDHKEHAFDVDFLTVNPYFGADGIEPFISDCKQTGKGLFILVKTSNPSSSELQNLRVDNRFIYEIMGDKTNDWGKELIGEQGYSSVGAVVGATHPNELTSLRKQLPAIFFLVPGYGAQGGSAADIVGSFDQNGKGAMINASRSIMCAHAHARWSNQYSNENYAQAARVEAVRMRDEINQALDNRFNK
jgi:orotidine-5'-phosphate decarboxylase